MGDKIRLQVEGMLPEMLQLVKRKIFTKEEVNQILKERENNEYLLERKNASVKDYLKVIEYEYGLEKMRRKRFKALKIKKENQKDFAIIRRILQLWDKITYKFRYRVDIWKQYLSFCYFIDSKKSFFKAITAALRFNPYNLDLWLSAAYYESDVNGNPFKGRKIFYKALKQNTKAVSFWIEYFKYEVKFIEKVMTRQILLTSDAKDIKEKELEAGADFLGFEEDKNKNDVLLELDNINSSDLEQMLTVLKEVYKLALENFKVTEFGFEFLQSLNGIKGKWFTEIQKTVTQDIRDSINQEQNDVLKNKYIAQLALALNEFSKQTLANDGLNDHLEELALKISEDQDLVKYSKAIYQYLLEFLIQNKNLISIDNLQKINNHSQFLKQTTQQQLDLDYLILLSQFLVDFKINHNREILEQLLNEISQQEEKVDDDSNLEQKNKENILEKLFNNKIDILVMQGGQEKAIKYIRLKLQNQRANSPEKRFKLLKKYYDIKMQIPSQFQEVNQQAFFNLCVEQLILSKEYFEQLILTFFGYLNEKKFTQQIQVFMKKLLSYKQQCPLSIYLQYISQYEKVESKKNELSQLWIYISQWYKSELAMWEAYFRWQRDFGGVQQCPVLLERASKTSGLDYSVLLAAYNSIIQ
ncbi:hypothetical protein ABPG74_015443 [Tetrahymena malaccensis]